MFLYANVRISPSCAKEPQQKFSYMLILDLALRVPRYPNRNFRLKKKMRSRKIWKFKAAIVQKSLSKKGQWGSKIGLLKTCCLIPDFYCPQKGNCGLWNCIVLYCMVFNAVFNSISIISLRPVHLSMLSCNSFNQYSSQYFFFKPLAAFPCNHCRNNGQQ